MAQGSSRCSPPPILHALAPWAREPRQQKSDHYPLRATSRLSNQFPSETSHSSPPQACCGKIVEIRGQFFHRCPAWRDQLGSNAAPGSNSAVSPSDCLWEVAPFFSAVLSMEAGRWLDSKGAHGQLGSQRIHNLAQILCPGLPVRWFPSERMEAAQGARGRALIQASDGSTKVPPQPWSLVHQRSGENVSGETSHSSPPAGVPPTGVPFRLRGASHLRGPRFRISAIPATGSSHCQDELLARLVGFPDAPRAYRIVRQGEVRRDLHSSSLPAASIGRTHSSATTLPRGQR